MVVNRAAISTWETFKVGLIFRLLHDDRDGWCCDRGVVNAYACSVHFFYLYGLLVLNYKSLL